MHIMGTVMGPTGPVNLGCGRGVMLVNNTAADADQHSGIVLKRGLQRATMS